jgi:protein involved in polysaccharide export with SLBB domain
MNATSRVVGAIALALLTVGCAGRVVHDPLTDGVLLEVTATEPVPLELRAEQAYRLKSGDELSVRVLGNDDLNAVAEIQLDGQLAVPWAGSLSAAGRTLAEVEQEIETALAGYLRYPDVSLTIAAFGPTRVFVTGEVRVPGSYEIVAGQTVLGAIVSAGGLLTTASTDEVLLFRRVSATQASVHVVDVNRVLKGDQDFGDPLVQHHDIVYVPRTLIADIGIFVDQFFNKLRPAFAFYLDGWEAFNVDKIRVIRDSRFIP